MNKKILLLLPALALILGGCVTKKDNSSSQQSSSQTVAVESVEISKTSATLDPRETLQLTAVAKPATLPDKSVVWSSNAPAVATVSSSGLVTAVAEGTAKIKAAAKADETKFAECTITVNKDELIAPEIAPDTEQTYKIGAYQANLEKRVYFKGSVDGDNRGETVDSWAGGVDVKFEENAGKYAIKLVSGANEGKYFEFNSSHRFAIVDEPTNDRLWSWNAAYKTVTNKISGTTYFPGTYNQFDTVSGCDIAMVEDDFIFEFLVKVEPCDPTAIDIVESDSSIFAGGSLKLHANLSPIGAYGKTIEWSVTGNSKVDVDENGLVEVAADADLAQHAVITAKWGELEDSVEITVKEHLNYGTLEDPLTVDEAKALIDKENPTSSKMYVTGIVTSNDAYGSYKNWGDNIYLANDAGTEAQAFIAYRAVPGKDTGYETTYAAANSMVGKRIIVAGTGKIYSTKYELDAKCELLSVTDGGITPTSITLDTNNFELEQGKSKTITAQLGPIGASGTVEWSVSPTGAGVTVENGVVAASNTATAQPYTIKATVQGIDPELSASVTCTVVEASGAITTMQAIYESGKVGDDIDVKGVYVGAYGNKTNEWYVANGDYAVYLYQVNIPDGLTVGDSVRIQGKLGVYKGLIQVVKDGATVTKIDDTITYNPLNYNGGAFTKALLSRPVQLTGTVKEGKAISSGSNTTVTVTVNGTDVNIYVKKSYGLDYTALNTALGTTNNTVTLKGYVAIYDGAATVNYDTSTGYQIVSPSVVS